MKPWTVLDTVTTPDGSTLRLIHHHQEYIIDVDRAVLMSSRQHGSEEALATEALKARGPGAPMRVLVGGLGMGYTLRATLDALPATARVDQVEVVPAVVTWNRGPLAHLAGHPLDDPRTTLVERDVLAVLREACAVYDAALLDVDNGADAFTFDDNAGLYSTAGIASIFRALRPGGVLAIWALKQDRGFEQRARKAGFRTRTVPVRARDGRAGSRHTIMLAVKPS